MIVCGSFQRLRGVTIRGTLRAGWLGSWLVESVVGERDWSNAGCRSLARPLGPIAEAGAGGKVSPSEAPQEHIQQQARSVPSPWEPHGPAQEPTFRTPSPSPPLCPAKRVVAAIVVGQVVCAISIKRSTFYIACASAVLKALGNILIARELRYGRRTVMPLPTYEELQKLVAQLQTAPQQSNRSTRRKPRDLVDSELPTSSARERRDTLWRSPCTDVFTRAPGIKFIVIRRVVDLYAFHHVIQRAWARLENPTRRVPIPIPHTLVALRTLVAALRALVAALRTLAAALQAPVAALHTSVATLMRSFFPFLLPFTLSGVMACRVQTSYAPTRHVMAGVWIAHLCSMNMYHNLTEYVTFRHNRANSVRAMWLNGRAKLRSGISVPANLSEEESQDFRKMFWNPTRNRSQWREYPKCARNDSMTKRGPENMRIGWLPGRWRSCSEDPDDFWKKILNTTEKYHGDILSRMCCQAGRAH
ncbi:hypothetical protein G5I_06121 [Acromyrmex echinatior]|uniref:Uncharacterized protein n=1 Tax=Acromyrmex echinatior TaxID=103372 RepID=F4WK77_ACREC|nr:hypothetical protein G5I_06121 [Acromyrmex echinatior]